jgi:hypothetical protein
MSASLIGFLSVVVVVVLGQHAFTGRKPSFASALNVYQSTIASGVGKKKWGCV